MSLAWKRLAISAFVIAHVSAVVITNLPACALKHALGRAWVDPYLMATGQWQYWGMFAPEPAKNTMALEAAVKDSHGLIHHFAFPRMMDQSAWAGFAGGYRHAKYVANLTAPTAKANREFAARYVVRKLHLNEDDFPIVVQLVCQVWPTNLPDAPSDEPPAAPYPLVLETYEFPNRAETQP